MQCGTVVFQNSLVTYCPAGEGLLDPWSLPGWEARPSLPANTAARLEHYHWICKQHHHHHTITLTLPGGPTVVGLLYVSIRVSFWMYVWVYVYVQVLFFVYVFVFISVRMCVRFLSVWAHLWPLWKGEVKWGTSPWYWLQESHSLLGGVYTHTHTRNEFRWEVRGHQFAFHGKTKSKVCWLMAELSFLRLSYVFS